MESTKGTDQYPYWITEFVEEFKGYEVLYVEEKFYNKERKQVRRNSAIDTADSYRVFMILCNQTLNKTRMEVLEWLKASTEAEPIFYQGEVFWSVKE